MLKYISTFVIGFFASLCAVFVPRMVAMLNGSSTALQYFHRDYILVGFAFALVIGGITVIFEKGRQKSAAEIFMAALGIPALLAGALNSGTTGNNMSSLQSVNQKLSENLAQKSGIAVEEKASNIIPLETIPNNGQSPTSKPGFSFISDARARENWDDSKINVSLNLGIQVEQTPYLIVLGTFNSKTEALQKAVELRKLFPKATAVQSGQNFLVIDGQEPLSKSDALLKAIEVQNKSGLKPYLLQAK
jgi:hypothetical protein